MTPTARILIVDDEPSVRDGLRESLSGLSHDVDAIPDGETALSRIRLGTFDLVVTDLRMPGKVDGLDVLREARLRNPDAAVIVITAYGTLEGAVEAMKLGAHDFLAKPIDIGHFRMVVEKALSRLELTQENRELKALLRRQEEEKSIAAESPAMRRVLETLLQVAPSHATVFLQGESGTGKELAARMIHRRSDRRDHPFVAVNCAALPETLFESELFGYEAGAFTGATHARKGLFEQAHGGTLFLDEVTEIALKNQVDLLRVIQEQEVRRIGGHQTVRIDVRIVAASNLEAKALVDDGRLREDLYYRLCVVPVLMPPLRDRREDIPALIDRFLAEFAEAYGKEHKRVSPAALEALTFHAWPGNIRQLRNLMERLVITCTGDSIGIDDLPPDLRSPARPATLNLTENLGALEKNLVQKALTEAGGHRGRTAELLGISVRNLHYKLRRHGLE